MSPQRFVPESYDAEKLAVLQQAFDAAWEQIKFRHLSPELTDDACRTRLAQVIVDLASRGVSDTDLLSRLAVKAIGDRDFSDGHQTGSRENGAFR